MSVYLLHLDTPLQHARHYGMSCQDCGERLEGYGYWAHEKDCLHRFLPVGDTEEVCTYCEMWRRKDNPQRDAETQARDVEKFGWYDVPEIKDGVSSPAWFEAQPEVEF